MMLISLLIDFLALTILLNVSLEPVSKTHQYWLLRGFVIHLGALNVKSLLLLFGDLKLIREDFPYEVTRKHI